MLKAPLKAIGALLLVAFVGAAQPALAQWAEFRPEGVGYSVEMPGEWTLKTEEIKTAAGTLKAHMASVNLDQRAFMTMYITYPAASISGRPVDAILDGARDGAVANVKGKLRKEERLTISNVPARQVIIDAPNDVVVIGRYLMMGNTLVQALVAGLANIENEPDTKRFLASLKLVSR
jgi:hypothetical protein